ncbi:hypothetical protein HY837_04710 [archaeon]|nr:hypothetical protein [archaeon]
MSIPNMSSITTEHLCRIFRDRIFNQRILPLIHPGGYNELGFQVNQLLFDDKYVVSTLGEGTENSMVGARCKITTKINAASLYVLLN